MTVPSADGGREATPPGLPRLARPSGAFAMLALDQRESLRSMLAAVRPTPVGDAEVAAFKVDAARALTPFASAVLLDAAVGLPAVRSAGALAPGCALIVAADRLTQEPGGPVEWTEVDEAVLADDALAADAAAYKLLVIWRRGEERQRARVVAAFVDGCRARARPAIVEGIVRPDAGRQLDPAAHAALVSEAAVELTGLEPDLYKAEVPSLGAADDGAIRDASAALTEAIPCPWVVLSNGTPPERFDAATVAACQGGASGFLAGRAIWTASLRAPDPAEHLSTVAAPRLAGLAKAVDEVVSDRRGGA
jgi:sulfofructosephosphate aldolase